eukprot:scaffold183881_cov28-Attheya_sp.AAC.1
MQGGFAHRNRAFLRYNRPAIGYSENTWPSSSPLLTPVGHKFSNDYHCSRRPTPDSRRPTPDSTQF